MTPEIDNRVAAPPALVAEPPARKVLEWHLITPEYPPRLGGVSDYTCQLAAGLAAEGDEVHVWCPGDAEESASTAPGVVVHRQCGSFSPSDLRRLANGLDAFPAPRRVLAQWVPHGFGYHSMNLAFCWWLWRRAARHGDRVELMVHEPFLTFHWTNPRQNVAALAHRAMTILLLRAASRVWTSIPRWERLLRPYVLGRRLPFQWLPIFSNIPEASDPARTLAVRRRYAPGDRVLIGHFGTYGAEITRLLDPILSALGQDAVDQTILLIGGRSEQYRLELLKTQPRLEGILQATGKLPAQEISHHLAACDLLIQPYPDGVSSRRTSLMAGLENGKPIVTTTGWLTEPLWLESGGVALSPAGDTDTFLGQVRQLRGQGAERLRVGKAGSKLYREHFDISHTISSLRQAHINLLQLPTGEEKCASS
jgi:glycosyltransferase involved in cell wall biosynthesis